MLSTDSMILKRSRWILDVLNWEKFDSNGYNCRTVAPNTPPEA